MKKRSLKQVIKKFETSYHEYIFLPKFEYEFDDDEKICIRCGEFEYCLPEKFKYCRLDKQK